MKKKHHIISTPIYSQPPETTDFSREVRENCEIVDYLGESSVRVWYNDQSSNYENHWHTATEIILPLENSYTVVINNTSYHINVGDIMIIPSCEHHELIAPPSGSRFIFLFDISIISKLSGFATLQPLLKQPILLTSEAYPRIYETEYNLLLQIRNVYFSLNSFRELSVYGKIIEFYVQIGLNHYESDLNNPYVRPNRQTEYIEKFNSILDYIDNHYMNDITLEDVAKSAGFSKYHFTRLFKQYTNTTFYDYLSYKRIKIAQDLLSKPELSITEIAFQSGFATISTFNRIFKKLIGCTPTDYRHIDMPNHLS